MKTSVTLSVNGLVNINDYCRDFKFIFCNREYLCSRFFAEFISPNVSRIHLTDPTIDTFFVDVDEDQSQSFECLLNLLKGKPIEFDDKEFKGLFSIAHKIGNMELVSLLAQECRHKITIENVIRRIIVKKRKDQNFSEEVKFIATKFSNFSFESLKELDIEIIEQILCSSHLRIKNEDFLFDIIVSFIEYETDKCWDLPQKVINLFQYIQFEFLTKDKMRKFIDMVSIESVSPAIWMKICSRLIDCQTCPSTSDDHLRYLKTTHNLPICGLSQNFDGIFQFLNRSCNGNAHEKKVIEITSSSDYSCPSHDVITKDWNSTWSSKNIEGSWWKVDFKNRAVALTGYSIKTGFGGKGCPHLKNWRIEGSNDNMNWEVIDEKTGNNDLDGQCLSHTWECPKSQPYRYIRLFGSGPNHYNNGQIFFSAIEFFGTLFD